MFTSLPRVTPPGEMRDGRCEVPPGGRRPFSHCCHDDAGCRELPGPRSYPSQRQRLVSAVGPPPRPVHYGGPEGSAGLHHGSAPSFSLGQCWSQSSPTAPVPEAGLGSGSVGHREPSRKPRGRPTPASRESQSCQLYLQTLESFGRAHRIETFSFFPQEAKLKIGRGCPLRCLPTQVSVLSQGPGT